MKFHLPHLWTLQDSSPGRDVVLALALKGLLLLALYLLFFGPAHRPLLDTRTTSEALLGAYPSKDAP